MVSICTRNITKHAFSKGPKGIFHISDDFTSFSFQLPQKPTKVGKNTSARSRNPTNRLNESTKWAKVGHPFGRGFEDGRAASQAETEVDDAAFHSKTSSAHENGNQHRVLLRENQNKKLPAHATGDSRSVSRCCRPSPFSREAKQQSFPGNLL